MTTAAILDEAIAIESADLRVAVLPHYGAKVVELTDKRTGRNWLVPGIPTKADGDDAVFDGRQSFGWDECFPTIAIRREPMPGWRDQPRDHGMLWGRPWQFEKLGTSITTTFEHADFAFSRRLAVDANRVTAHYTVESRAAAGRPYLWSAHPDFALRPGERIELPGVRSMAATYVRRKQRTWPAGELAWPEGDVGGASFRLDEVHAKDAELAVKLYAAEGQPEKAIIRGSDGRLVLTWDKKTIPYFGLWLDYGGWPDAHPVHQVALEPTTAPADDLWSAAERGLAAMLPAKGVVRWWLEIALEPKNSLP